MLCRAPRRMRAGGRAGMLEGTGAGSGAPGLGGGGGEAAGAAHRRAAAPGCRCRRGRTEARAHPWTLWIACDALGAGGEGGG